MFFSWCNQLSRCRPNAMQQHRRGHCHCVLTQRVTCTASFIYCLKLMQVVSGLKNRKKWGIKNLFLCVKYVLYLVHAIIAHLNYLFKLWINYPLYVKVTLTQKEFMRTLIFQNCNKNIVRISDLKVFYRLGTRILIAFWIQLCIGYNLPLLWIGLTDVFKNFQPRNVLVAILENQCLHKWKKNGFTV